MQCSCRILQIFSDSPVLRYGLAADSFAIALGLALLAQRYHVREGL